MPPGCLHSSGLVRCRPPLMRNRTVFLDGCESAPFGGGSKQVRVGTVAESSLWRRRRTETLDPVATHARAVSALDRNNQLFAGFARNPTMGGDFRDRLGIYKIVGGVVEEIFFADKQVVAKDDLLIRLRNLDLSLEMEAIRGQMATTRQQLETLNFQLARSGLQREQRQQLTGERRVLEQQMTTLDRTMELNRKKLAAQEIAAPIDGQVITWNPEQRLRGLVIKPNDIVLTLSKLDGPWQLEVKIPQNKVGYIDAATEDADEPLDVAFTLGTNPNETFAGTLNRISIRPTPDDSGVPNYRGLIDVATVDADRFKSLRPGVGVTAKIECGQVPLYKYCFHQIIDWLNVNVFF